LRGRFGWDGGVPPWRETLDGHFSKGGFDARRAGTGRVNDLWISLLQVRSDLVYAAGLVIALCVTVHVLLRKREVATAAGWIGLAWFAPITGGIIYFLFGVNRVRRRARQDRPPSDASDEDPELTPIGDERLHMLQRGIGRITGRPIVPGNAVQVYDAGDEAYPQMLQAIATARRSVGLSSYIFRDDIWGARFTSALVEAHRRGVAVRVIIDGIGGGWLLSRTYRRLRREGVPAARFFHSLVPWRMPFLNLRSHKKVLVVDGAVGFTGGMNIADENVIATRPKRPVLDTHFWVKGPVVAQLTEAFLKDWAFATGEVLEDEAWYPDVAIGPGSPARVIDSGPDEDIEKVEFAVLEAVTCARASIVLMTPYFLPDERLLTALALAAMRGVALDVVIPERSNKIVVDWATRANIGPLLASGVRIWRSPLPFRHSKMMVVDGEWCLIGSSNWDIRSFRLNFELCIEIYDPQLAATLSAMMQRCCAQRLTQADLDRRSVPVRLRDAAARLLLPYL
jgi:cardiolipin synthase